MRRYVVRMHESCTTGRRREIRGPERRELNQQPDHVITEFQLPVMPQMMATVRDDYANMRYDQTDMYTYRQLFETVCFSTMTWVEEHVEGGTSCGHHHIFDSYFQVPQGVDLPMAERVPDGAMYHDVDTEPYRGLSGEGYYRVRMLELERQLDDLQRTRAVLPREEIQDIGHAIEQGRDKPVPFEHFDENIFKME